MNDADWTAIAGKLEAIGFTVVYERISYDPERPLWCAKASRDGRQWITMGKHLAAVFVELEKQTQEADTDWRGTILCERMSQPAEVNSGII